MSSELRDAISILPEADQKKLYEGATAEECAEALSDYAIKLEAERDALQARLNEAVGRIKDILIQDDGQAYKEAAKCLDKLEGEG